MPRPKASEPRDRQLLLRLTARQLEVLEAVAHLERTTPNAYAHEVLVEHLAAMATNHRVQADLSNRAAYATDAATATRLTPKGARTSRGNGGSSSDRRYDELAPVS